ncbi:Asp23/Gls24 family envelope stress response protein [Dietzia psychralcaliphila]|uniref:Asp23/Gls24 family envelope stress response protein n=1 Tax=Dietzia psychralcaliphila TaxID=139021 RepID=UPI001C1E8A22|nr:Asp23/Gls24 family envelope stress response protein [Dietzia psychralcaliphila]
MTAAQTEHTGRRPAPEPAAVEEFAPPVEAPRPAAERGLTTIPASVVGRIAEQVASEYTHVGGAAGGLLGVGARRDFDSRPSATCDLYGTVAVLRLDVGVAFPVNLADTCRGLRQHVRERVGELTGLQVGRLDIEISWLNPGTATRGALR